MLYIRARVLFFTLFFGACFFAGCGENRGKSAAKDKNKHSTLVLYNWEDYIGAKTVKNFQKETGIDVREAFYDDEEAMLGAVQSDLSAYDLVVASDDMVREMLKGKLLAELDFSKIPNIKNIYDNYLNTSWDPDQKYTVPYLAGTTGIVINKKYIKENTDSWAVLFDNRYKGKIAMLNNPFEVMAAASKVLGYSINTTDPGEIAQVKELLLEQKPDILGYLDVVKIQNMMIDEELWAAHIYSGEGLVACDENENLEYVIPGEGAVLWLDSFVMPRDAKHREEAHAFLNYILRPKVNAAIASELWYATADREAVEFVDPEVLDSESVYPPPEFLERCELFEDIGETTLLLNQLWSDLLASD
jgi:spermidine/putrescine-binding protein